jgi:hypothetical protein
VLLVLVLVLVLLLFWMAWERLVSCRSSISGLCLLMWGLQELDSRGMQQQQLLLAYQLNSMQQQQQQQHRGVLHCRVCMSCRTLSKTPFRLLHWGETADSEVHHKLLSST